MNYVYRVSSPQDKKVVLYALSSFGAAAAKKTITGNGYRASVRKLKLCCVPKDEMFMVKLLARSL